MSLQPLERKIYWQVCKVMGQFSDTTSQARVTHHIMASSIYAKLSRLNEAELRALLAVELYRRVHRRIENQPTPETGKHDENCRDPGSGE